MVVIDAIKRAGSADPLAIRDALAETAGFRVPPVPSRSMKTATP